MKILALIPNLGPVPPICLANHWDRRRARHRLRTLWTVRVLFVFEFKSTHQVHPSRALSRQSERRDAIRAITEQEGHNLASKHLQTTARLDVKTLPTLMS
jgi:hypothetical protein